MNDREIAEFDESRVTDESCLFAADLFARFPEFRCYAAMERQPGEDAWALVVTMPAPSGDSRSDMVIWLNGGTEPSVAFGNWHAHQGWWGSEQIDRTERMEFLDLIAGILADRHVVCEDVGGTSGWRTTVLDLQEPDALLEELTSKDSSGRARLVSWSGRLDWEVGLEDLDLTGVVSR